MPELSDITPFSVDHHGLIAGMVKELGIVRLLDERLPLAKDNRTKSTHGQRVMAMMLYGLGFYERALYTTEHYFTSMPIEELIGPGVKAEYLNDDALGRTLDDIAEYGSTRMFSEIAMRCIYDAGLLTKNNHLDSSSLTLFGCYDDTNENCVTPCLGYSKDHRPDLKQVVVNLITNGPGGLPLWFELKDGNQSDKTQFHKTIADFRAQFTQEDNFLWVADSALYNKEELQNSQIRWLTRAPNTLKQVKQYCQADYDDKAWTPLESDYQAQQVDGAKGQRWYLIQSQAGKERDLKTLKRKIEKECKTWQLALKAFSKKEFACETDALAEVTLMNKKLKWHHLHVQQIRCQSAPSSETKWHIDLTVKQDEGKITPRRQACGRFILASNDKNLDAQEMLTTYKEQDTVERGFRFLKDPRFELNHIFLKNATRIEALMMIMTLCLLVNNLAQYKICKGLKETNQTVLSQIKKPTQTPTLRWISQCLRGVIMLYTDGKWCTTCNVSPEMEAVFRILGKEVLKTHHME